MRTTLWRALGEVVCAPQAEALLEALRALIAPDAQPLLDRAVRYARQVFVDGTHIVGLMVSPLAIEFLARPGARMHVIDGTDPAGCAQVEHFLPADLGAQSLVVDARLYDATTLAQATARQWRDHLLALNRGNRDPGLLGPGVRLAGGIGAQMHYAYLVAAVRYGAGAYVDPDLIAHPPGWPGAAENPARAIRVDEAAYREKGVLVSSESTGAHLLDTALRRGEQRQRCDQLKAFLAASIADRPRELWYARGVRTGQIQLMLAGPEAAAQCSWTCRPEDDDSLFADALYAAAMVSGLDVARMSACTPADYHRLAARHGMTVPTGPTVPAVPSTWRRDGRFQTCADAGGQ